MEHPAGFGSHGPGRVSAPQIPTEEKTMSATTTYRVTGMTCGHCEGAVTEELSALDGVSSVKAVAATGLVTVTSEAPLDDAAVRAAVDEAGYELAGRA